MTVGQVADPTSRCFDHYDRLLQSPDGPGAALDALIEALDREDRPRELLEALLLKARHELGLPPIQSGPLTELTEPVRTQYEMRYIAAIRRVGMMLLQAGDLPAAWPYLRAIAEKEPMVAALEAYRPSLEEAQADSERLGQVIEVAFHQGVHPRRGFELILEHYGACSAITAFEHLPPEDSVRRPCVDLLVGTLHDNLGQSLRADIVRKGLPEPPPGTPITALLAGRDWLFADDAYHIDVSHLGAVVRYAPMATDPDTLRRAVELAEYGRRLSPRYRHEGEPPFQDTYADHALYLRALLGEEVDAALAHFRSRLPVPDPSAPVVESLPAQILVRLLERLGRDSEAIEVAAEHLADVPDSMLLCTSLAGLCQRAGRLDLLARSARQREDPVQYLAAILPAQPRPVF